jgi:hypothetical protein
MTVCSMARRHSLPLFALGQVSLGLDQEQRPTVDAVRKRLGGRGATEPGAGELVLLTTAGGDELPGVILFTAGDEIDVWVDQRAALSPVPARAGVVRRARRADAAPLRGPPPKELDAVAGDARLFGSLLEGQRIRFQTGDAFGEGVLAEKCRFGALVVRDDGTLLGVGFRRIWPTWPQGAAGAGPI